jgi:hypothetical protein
MANLQPEDADLELPHDTLQPNEVAKPALDGHPPEQIWAPTDSEVGGQLAVSSGAKCGVQRA